MMSKRWYFGTTYQTRQGPISTASLKALAINQLLDPEILIWSTSSKAPIPASDCKWLHRVKEITAPIINTNPYSAPQTKSNNRSHHDKTNSVTRKSNLRRAHFNDWIIIKLMDEGAGMVVLAIFLTTLLALPNALYLIYSMSNSSHASASQIQGVVFTVELSMVAIAFFTIVLLSRLHARQKNFVEAPSEQTFESVLLAYRYLFTLQLVNGVAQPMFLISMFF